jgi:hypothetical protein
VSRRAGAWQHRAKAKCDPARWEWPQSQVTQGTGRASVPTPCRGRREQAQIKSGRRESAKRK